MKLNHSYSVAGNDLSDSNISEEKVVVLSPNLVKELYDNYVTLSSEQISVLEVNTRLQSNSKLWFDARNLHSTASVMKEV